MIKNISTCITKKQKQSPGPCASRWYHSCLSTVVQKQDLQTFCILHPASFNSCLVGSVYHYHARVRICQICNLLCMRACMLWSSQDGLLDIKRELVAWFLCESGVARSRHKQRLFADCRCRHVCETADSEVFYEFCITELYRLSPISSLLCLPFDD